MRAAAAGPGGDLEDAVPWNRLVAATRSPARGAGRQGDHDRWRTMLE
jgi:hypothetical protein